MAYGTAPSNLWTCKDESMDWVRVRGQLERFSKSQPTKRCKPKRLRFRNVFSFKKYQKNASRLPLSWWFKPKPLSQTTISTALHSSSIRTPLTWCHRGIEAAAWWNGGWEVLAMCWSTALMFIKLKLRCLGVGLIYGAKLLPDICSKVIWGTCMCREICGIYTQLKNINSGLDFWCAFETKNTSSLQACRSKTWDFCPKKRYTPPTWESLQARNVHNISHLESSHQRKSSSTVHQFINSGSILSPKRRSGAKMEGTDFQISQIAAK